MLVSLIGPTNIGKFSEIIGKPVPEIKSLAKAVGESLAKSGAKLLVGFNYSGMIRLVGDAYKTAGGKELQIVYTENDWDWDTQPYLSSVKLADKAIKQEDWHKLLHFLVTEPDFVVCAGLSAGVMAEIGYMKWNYQESKGMVKKLIGIKPLLRDGKFPPEFEFDMKEIISYAEPKDLAKALKG